MTIEQYIQTQNWNKERGYTKFSLGLESDMLNEEQLEFYEAYDVFNNEQEGTDRWYELVADMVDAICDLRFVFVGTEFKVSRTKLEGLDLVQYSAMAGHIERQLSIQETLLSNMQGGINMSECYQFVLEANQAKPAKTNAVGKGIKGDTWVDPKIKIIEYLKTLL